MKNNKNTFMLILDIFFVLFLCFILLLFTLLLNRGGEMQIAGKYIINPTMLAAVIISVFVYLYFMTKVSIRELTSILSGMSGFSSSTKSTEKNGIK